MRHWLHHIKSCLCVPVDPPDTEFDCVGVNGEGSYYTAVVGGVSNVAEYVYSCCCTVMYSRAECVRMCEWASIEALSVAHALVHSLCCLLSFLLMFSLAGAALRADQLGLCCSYRWFVWCWVITPNVAKTSRSSTLQKCTTSMSSTAPLLSLPLSLGKARPVPYHPTMHRPPRIFKFTIVD